MQTPYPKLFLRTAIHIGAALAAFVLLGAAILGLIAAWELRGYVETRHSSLGEEAASVLGSRGRAGLVEWLTNEAAIPEDVSVYVLDEDANDILGRQLPGQYTQFIKESVIGEPVPEDSRYLPVRLAPRLLGPDGAELIFLVLPKGISLWGSRATLLGLLGAALLVISTVAWLMARAFSRPISELQLAVRELASGDTSARVPPRVSARKDELGALAADFNFMANRLEELIAGRETLLREMSHELRSPLARLQAAVALAASRNSFGEAESARLEQEISRMNRVIGEMLRYSSLQASVAPRRKLVRIDRCLRELVNVEEIEATSRGCRLELRTEGDLAIIGDPELLTSGFENILRNAIRYAPQDSVVNIVARQKSQPGGQDEIEVSISDSGPGVPADSLEKIFEPYYRIANGNHDSDSTGLGLAIVRKVFERHGGQVAAQPHPQQGLIVTVRLPAAGLA